MSERFVNETTGAHRVRMGGSLSRIGDHGWRLWLKRATIPLAFVAALGGAAPFLFSVINWPFASKEELEALREDVRDIHAEVHLVLEAVRPGTSTQHHAKGREE